MMKGTTTPVMMMRMTKVLVITTMAEVHGTKKPLMMMFNMTNTARKISDDDADDLVF